MGLRASLMHVCSVPIEGFFSLSSVKDLHLSATAYVSSEQLKLHQQLFPFFAEFPYFRIG